MDDDDDALAPLPHDEAAAQDELNDETFGDMDPVDAHFDFDAANARLLEPKAADGIERMLDTLQLAPPPPTQPSTTRRAMTLAEVEAELLQGAATQPLVTGMPTGPTVPPMAVGPPPGLSPHPHPHHAPLPTARPPSAIGQVPLPQAYPPHPYGNVPMSDIEILQRMAYESRQAQIEYDALARKRRYDRIMTPYDRNLVCRIQLSQMRLEDPYMDDFYFLAFRNRTLGTGTALPAANASSIPPRAPQPRVKREMLTTAVMIEGALGVIPRSVVARPKTLMRVLSNDETVAKTESTPAADGSAPTAPVSTANNQQTAKTPHNVMRQVMSSIEMVYQAIIDMEDSDERDRRDAASPAPMHGAAPPEGGDEPQKKPFRTIAPRHVLQLRIVRGLLLAWPTGKETPEPTFADRNSRENIARFLKVPKGQRLIKRALAFLPKDQQIGATLLLGRAWDLLTMNTSTGSVEIDQFGAAVSTPVTAIINQLSFSHVLEMMRGILDSWSLFSMFKVVTSKIGLSLLNPLLMRAEVLKQTAGAVSEADLGEWLRLFGLLFTLLRGYYLTALNQSAVVNDTWLLLTFVALHANQQQRYELLSEIRDKVLQSLKIDGEGESEPSKAVTTLLMAMGIDYRQLIALNKSQS